jgi:LacI family transcriptional regulator
MGYYPDPALRALVAYRTGQPEKQTRETVAYLTNWDTRWGWRAIYGHNQFFIGASNKAAKLGYQLEHFWLSEPGMTQKRLTSMLYHRGVRGVLVASHQLGSDALEEIDWSQLSAVKIDCIPHKPALHHVTNDQNGVTRLAMRQILSSGYKRVGLVMPQGWDDFVDQSWSAGFLVEQRRLPGSCQIPMLVYPDSPFDEEQQTRPKYSVVPRGALAEWYRLYRPEVILSYAPFVMPTLAQLGISIPRDVGYVDMFLEGDSGYAGVRQNCERVGEVAMEILVSQLQQNIRGVPSIPTTTLVDGTWENGFSLPVGEPTLRGPKTRLVSDPCNVFEAAACSEFRRVS